MSALARVPLLPAALQSWPSTVLLGAAPIRSDAAAQAALERIRAETLWWPAPRRGAAAVEALCWGEAGRRAASTRGLRAAPAGDPAQIEPAALRALLGPPPAAARAGALGGLEIVAAPPPDPIELLRRAVGRDPWSGSEIALESALDAAALLRGAAMANRGPVRLAGMSPWKRRCLRPFLTGPDGPPRRARSGERPGDGGGPLARWGADGPADLLAEDGFLRSIGLGLRHVPPLSVTVTPDPPHFDATRPNAFERVVAEAEFTPELLSRARALREMIVAARLSKYNLPPDRARLPDPGRRRAVLVAGQVADDASIRLGAREVRDDGALIAAVRALRPRAFLLYKPHPDVVTGLRRGKAGPAALALADAVVQRAAPEDCFDWADEVATVTSLAGFEALLRGKAATTFGRPFYAGWGLTTDADPPPRPRDLSLDALTAAALILLPRYVEPRSGLPCPPEVAVEALLRTRAGAATPRARLTRLWRDALSRLLARL